MHDTSKVRFTFNNVLLTVTALSFCLSLIPTLRHGAASPVLAALIAVGVFALGLGLLIRGPVKGDILTVFAEWCENQSKGSIIMAFVFLAVIAATSNIVPRIPALARAGLEKQLNVSDRSSTFEFVFDNAITCKREGIIFGPSNQECEVRLYTLIEGSDALADADRTAAKKMVHPIIQTIF